MRMRKRTIRWIGSLSALLLLVLGVTLALPVAWGQGDDVLPPHVFDTMPLPGEELPLDGAVTFFFDQPMDADSVGTAFSVDPVVAGALSWPDEASLVFTPSGEYTRAAEYTFTIGTGAQSVAGAAMEEAFTLALQTVGYLEVSEVLPAPDSSAVDTDSIITVIFNRPVVPLLSVEDMGNLPHPLTFDPPVEGSGEWLNTSIYLFTPSGELQGGTNYTLTIPAGLEDVTGGVLAEDYSWRFSTLRPDVLEITPNDDYDRARLDQKVTVRFSQAMNPATIDAGFELVKIEGDLPVIPVPGTFEWSEDFRSVTFTPDEQLQLESRYRVDIEADLVLSSTGATLREDATSRFYTLPYPQIRNTSPHDGEQNAWPYGGFTIYFNTLMDLDSLEGKVIIDPEPWREYDTYFYDWGYNYSLSFDTEPATEYTITILPGMADIYGNTIDEGMVVTYTTAPYPPELTVQATGRVGMYNAYNPTTRVFLTHRNVSRVDLGLWNVPLTQFARMVGPDSYDYWRNYEPAMTNALRRWSIDVSSQQDRRRYELLLISDKGPSGISNIQCLAAPDPQVKVGDVVIVTPDDPTPLNVRSEPNLAANVVTQVLPGETMQIIGGPFCEGGFLWWQIRLNNDIIGWAAEGTQENYFYAPLGAAPAD
ncbi:MAG: Ig-like domain-containing protein, partial [Anaerolineae bacterium]|nr:Ig-like domain-containing protein [Anaerolineae bacterium]